MEDEPLVLLRCDGDQVTYLERRACNDPEVISIESGDAYISVPRIKYVAHFSHRKPF